MKFTIKFDTSKLRKTLKRIENMEQEAFTPQNAYMAGKGAVAAMKELISRGISPIYGKGKFPPYKESYKKQIRGELGFFTHKITKQKIPYIPAYKNPLFLGKYTSPVNLKLTGHFMKKLQFWVLSNSAFSIGYKDRLAQLKEEGHAIGWNQQMKRPTIPQPGERFAVEIESEISKVYVDAIERFLGKL